MIVKLRLFLGSFAPLFGLLALRFDDVAVVSICAGLMVAGVVTSALAVFSLGGQQPEPHHVVTATDEAPNVAGYLATYLLPFVTVSAPTIRDFVAYVIFIALVATIFVRADMAHISPLHYCLGYRSFRITTTDNLDGYLLTRSAVASGDVIHAVQIGRLLIEPYRRSFS